MRSLHVGHLHLLVLALLGLVGLPLALAAVNQGNVPAVQEAFLTRHDYKMSLSKPMVFNLVIPHFKVDGDVITTDDYVRLTPSMQSMKGSLWAEEPVKYKNWQAVITFSVTGRGRLGGDGFAFWYVSRPLGLGDAMGAEAQFDGLMVSFDTYDNDNNRQNPYVGAILNDGSKRYNPDTDGSDLAFAGCTAAFRNAAAHVMAKITYYKETLTLEIDTSGKGKNYQTCFRTENIVLPAQYFIGLTAATGALADDHDIHAFNFYELDPPAKNKPQKASKPENIVEKENLERVQEQIQILRAKHDIPGVDSNYEAFIGKIANMEQLIAELAKLTNSQLEIRGLIDDVLYAIRGLSSQMVQSQTAAHIAQNTQQGKPGPVVDGSTAIIQKLNELQNDLRVRANAGDKSQGSSPNDAVFSSVTRIETTLRQLSDRMTRFETQQSNNLMEIQALRRDLESGVGRDYTQRTTNKASASDSEGSSIWIVIVVVLIVIALVGAAAFFKTRKSDDKKFI